MQIHSGFSHFIEGGLPHPTGGKIHSSLLEYLPVAIYTCDNDGKITFYNKPAAELWGREPEIGKDFWCGSFRIFYPDGTPMPLEACPMALLLNKGKSINNVEIVIERPDGSRVNVIPYPRPLYDDNNKMIGAINMLMDVTDQKIRITEASKLAAIVESSDDAIISKSLEGIVTSWNNSAERIFGYTAEEMIGEPILKLIPADRAGEEPEILSRLRKGERVDHFETKRVTKDNKIIDISLTISPIRNPDGVITGASKIARDITAQKESERIIKEAEERFRMAVEATQLGTWDYDFRNSEFKLSPESRKILGLPDDVKFTGSLVSNLLLEDDRELVNAEVAKAMNCIDTVHYDLSFRINRFSDAAVRWVRSQGKIYCSPQGELQRFMGTVLDITDSKTKMETLELLVEQRTTALLKMNTELQQSNASLEQFAAVASHDLQEPLRKIMIFADRIVQNPGDEKTFQNYFLKIGNSAKRMSQLIKDVLQYAQVSRAQIALKEVDLNEVLEVVKADFELLLEETHGVITSDVLPVIKCNPPQMQQLFSNIISNSIKFSKKEPEITITSRVLTDQDLPAHPAALKRSDRYLELNFSDNGIGFDQRFADQVFVIFQRLTNKNEYTGTGIGLSICKKVVENHHGDISVKSLPGIGTTFTILLPFF